VLDGDEHGVARLPAEDTWRMVRDLPFVRVSPSGLEMHPVVQEVAATALELRSPGRTRELRRRASRAAAEELRRAPGWESTADLLHLIQNPVIRNAFIPPAGLQHPVETARPDDATAVDALLTRFDGDEAAAVLRRWWSVHPEAFSVLRGPDGEVAAVSVVHPLDLTDPDLDRSDPVLAAIRTHAERPRRAGPGGRATGSPGRALVVRRALAATTGERLSPDLAPMIIDLKRTYLAMRPALDRIYSVLADWTGAGAPNRAMGFQTCGEPVEVGSRHVQVSVLELGPGSVDGWLAHHIEMETSDPTTASPSASAEPTGSESPSIGLARLSARELEVLAALADGLTNRELAERLFISERTANRHLSNIFTKLGVHNRTAAARVAIEAGLAR
jgi:DNA-binding CsgD family transcriptional regulator